MRKLYNEFFYIPKYGKIREKVMLVRAAVTVAVIVICLTAMSLTAYAYFSCNVISGSNIIKAAHFEADITVTDANDIRVEPVSKENQTVTFNFTDPGVYTVKLAKGSSTAETGFCVVYFEKLIYHTQQIGADITVANGKRDFVEFKLEVKTVAAVKIESHWGTSSFYSQYNSTSAKEWYIENTDPHQVITLEIAATANGTLNEVEGTKSAETTVPFASEPAYMIHTVAAGENLTVIAKKYGTTVDSIVGCNDLADPNNIQTGFQLKIPLADEQTPTNAIELATIVPSAKSIQPTDITIQANAYADN